MNKTSTYNILNLELYYLLVLSYTIIDILLHYIIITVLLAIYIHLILKIIPAAAQNIEYTIDTITHNISWHFNTDIPMPYIVAFWFGEI